MDSKAIIQAIEECNDIVSKAECEISIEPENQLAINNAIKRLILLSELTLQQIDNH